MRENTAIVDLFTSRRKLRKGNVKVPCRVDKRVSFRAIIDILNKNRLMTTKQIAEELGYTTSHVNTNLLKPLIQHGVVEWCKVACPTSWEGGDGEYFHFLKVGYWDKYCSMINLLYPWG